MDESSEKDPARRPLPLSPGLSIIGLFVTGITGIGVGIAAGSGVALLASAASFGLVAWIAFR